MLKKKAKQYKIYDLKKRFLWSLIVFFVVFIPLGLFVSSWGFGMDDAGMIYSSYLKIKENFFSPFFLHDSPELFCPSNYKQGLPMTQLGVPFFYRPLTLIFFALQYPLFGASAYAYFLVMMFFHALNAVLLFNIFLLIFESFMWAFLSALLFGFNLTLWTWIGWVAAQPYVTSLHLTLWSLILFFFYLKTQRYSLIIASSLSYMTSLFLFETSLAFPVIILMLFFARDLLQSKQLWPHEVATFTHYMKLSLPLWFSFLFYLGARFYSCCIHSSLSITSHSNMNSLLKKFLTRKGELYAIIADMYNISFIPSNHPFLKGSLILLLTSSFLYLFRNNKYKKAIITFSCCFLVSLWLPILIHYIHRYIYHALPFYALTVGLLFAGYHKTASNKALYKKLSYVGSCLIATASFFNICFITKHIKAKEKVLVNKLQACKHLAQQVTQQEQPLCFLALPVKLFWTGLAQEMWMVGIKKNVPIYYEANNFITCEKQMSNPMVTRINHGFRFQLRDNSQAHFLPHRGVVSSLGEKTINNVDGKNGQAVDINYKIHEKYWQQNPIFITWDYEKEKFKILSELKNAEEEIETT